MFSKFWDARTARILFTALVFVAVLAFLRGARETLTLFLFAILFAYLVDPLVSRLERPLKGRIKAIAVVYLVLIGVLIGAGFAIGPRIADESKSLMATMPSLVDRMASGQLVGQLGHRFGMNQERTQQLQLFIMSHRDSILGYAKAVGASIAEPLTHIWWLILIPILSLFFLKDGASMAQQFVRFSKREDYRRVTAGVVEDTNVMLGSYIRAQLVLAGLTLVVLTVVLSIMGVPYSFILGPLAGICEFIPVVGPAVAAVAIFGIGALTGYSHLLWLFLLLGGWRLVQDYVSAPRIMGKSLEISPLAQIFAVLAGGEIGGVVGALVSVPILAILRILWTRLSSGSIDTPAAATLPHSDTGRTPEPAVVTHPPAAEHTPALTHTPAAPHTPAVVTVTR